jgi:hypothetical protein
MEENLEAYLKKVWDEYVEYRDYLKSISKPHEELKREAAEKITATTTKTQAQEIYLETIESKILHNQDFFQQQQRLFHTVEAFKTSIPIPEEIKKELDKSEFMQIFAIKDGKAVVINTEAVDFTKKQIGEAMKNGIEDFKKRWL